MPEELDAAFRTRAWGLPYAGGWKDQPAGFLEAMELAEQTYTIMREYYALRGGEVGTWIKRHPHEWEHVQRIEKLQREEND